MKIIWLTIPRAFERQALFKKKNLDKFPCLDWHRFDGIDCISHSIRPSSGRVTEGQIAGWLSHYAIISSIALLDERVLVIEDDTFVSDDFPEVFKRLQACTGWVYPHTERRWGMWSYSIDGITARWMLEHMRWRSNTIDMQVHEMVNCGLRMTYLDKDYVDYYEIESLISKPSW